jgi:hypothetical protein
VLHEHFAIGSRVVPSGEHDTIQQALHDVGAHDLADELEQERLRYHRGRISALEASMPYSYSKEFEAKARRRLGLREAIEEALIPPLFREGLHPRDRYGRWTLKHLATLNAISRDPFHGELATRPEAKRRIKELRDAGLVKAQFVKPPSGKFPGRDVRQGGLVLTAKGDNLLSDTIGHGPRAAGDTGYWDTVFGKHGVSYVKREPVGKQVRITIPRAR